MKEKNSEQKKGIIKKVVDGLVESTKEAHTISKEMHKKNKRSPKDANRLEKERRALHDEKMASVNPYIKTKLELQKDN